MRKGARDASGRDREGERERTAEDASKRKADIETGEVKSLRDEPGGCPSIGQVVSGVKVARARSAAPARNVGRRVPTHPRPGRWARVGERERVVRRKPETLSTVAAPAGGPARSSAEAPVMGVERRGRLIED